MKFGPYIFFLMIGLQGCLSYNMRQNYRYGNLASAYTDSSDCARHCHKDSLALAYMYLSMRYNDSMNLYYMKAHPHFDKPVIFKQPKCNCK